MPKPRDLGFFPRWHKDVAEISEYAVNKELKWFAHIFKSDNEIFSTLWDSVFVDGQERGDLDSFMDALPEHMYESDDDAVRSENQDENDELLEEDYVF